jgi:hypothetical protein
MKLFIDYKNATILILLMGIVIISPSSFANETEESESSSAAAYEVAPPSLEMDSTESTDFEEVDDNEE